MAEPFFSFARNLYDCSNEAGLRWMMERKPLHGVYLNTKINSISLEDYSSEDGRRGPEWVYGWIQGRGLESIVTHLKSSRCKSNSLTVQMHARASSLYSALNSLLSDSGHAYFCYDKLMQPAWNSPHQPPSFNLYDSQIYTYSDVFFAKGLIAASVHFNSKQTMTHVRYLAEIISSIEENRFQIDESIPANAQALERQPNSYGPRMILLGAANLLQMFGQSNASFFADRFINYILDRHLDQPTSLLRDHIGGDSCNPGHAIEFVGFSLEYLPADADPGLIAILEKILLASFYGGFKGPGICLDISIQTGCTTSTYYPWWSLPEAIRAAALLYNRTHSVASLTVWRVAHEAFFRSYWRTSPPIAFQTLTADGPVDFVPATSDLDPGYHTGLSLLCASKIAEICEKSST